MTKKERQKYLAKWREENRDRINAYNCQWMKKKRAELRATGNYDICSGWKKKKKYSLGIAFGYEIFKYIKPHFWRKVIHR